MKTPSQRGCPQLCATVPSAVASYSALCTPAAPQPQPTVLLSAGGWGGEGSSCVPNPHISPIPPITPLCFPGMKIKKRKKRTNSAVNAELFLPRKHVTPSHCTTRDMLPGQQDSGAEMQRAGHVPLGQGKALGTRLLMARPGMCMRALHGTIILIPL
ncbi:unnamed protein product [Caretta caretta]